MRPSTRSRRCDSRLVIAVGCVVAAGAAGAWAASKLDPLLTVTGGAAGDTLGYSTCAIGDVNGDGVPDFVVGAADEINETYGGYALVISGADGKTIHKLTGSAADLFGHCVAAVPDTDGDGLDDVLVGAPKEYSGKQQTGAAHLFSGKDGSLLYDFFGDTGGDEFGTSVAGLADLDGDGYGDLAVGARYAMDPSSGRYPGMVRVFTGNGGKELWSLYGTGDGDEFGSSVCDIGDIDGDGASDLAVGAQFTYDSTSAYYVGSVQIVSGQYGKTITTLYGAYDLDYFGSCVAPAGDVDGDGTPDLIVGAVLGDDGNGNTTGSARVFSGADWSVIHTFFGDAHGDRLGRSVGGGKDMDGDGVDDLVVGVPWMVDDGGATTGAVRWYSGKDGSTIDTVFGLAHDDRFGWSVALIDDVSGDEVPDTIAGMPLDDGGDDGATDDAGAVVVIGAAKEPPSGSISIDAGAAATNATAVTLSLSWTDGTATVSEMRLRDAGGSWGAWESLASTKSWTLPSTDGTKTVEAQFRDDGALESAVASDAILLDTVAPTGSVTIETGAAWTKSPDVTLALASSDAGIGVAHFRVRNSTDAGFGDWIVATTAFTWRLTDGGGAKTVDVQYEDAAGNVSSVYSDSISVDLVRPTGSVVVEAGEDVVNQRNVSLTVSASDTGGSGLWQMRVKNSESPLWGNWQAYTGAVPWILPSGDGTREVQVQFRDVALNESDLASDSIVLDESLPVIVSFALHDPHPYYLADESIGFDLAAEDTSSGTGIDAAKTTWDGGATWTDWTDVSAGGVYTPERPPLAGPVSAQVVVRDRAGNESERSAAVTMQFLDVVTRDLKSGGRGTGSMSGSDDLDTIGLDLVKGDVLSVAVKATGKPAKKSFLLAVDLARADGTRLFTGKYPSRQKTPGVKGYVAPATGRYVLVVRNADTAGTSLGSYTLTVTVKHSKANTSRKGTAAAGEFSFDAAVGTTLSGTLKGAGLDPKTVTITGPDDVPVTLKTKVKAGTVNINPVKLNGGTGTYTVRFTATGPVAYTWRATLPKPVVVKE